MLSGQRPEGAGTVDVGGTVQSQCKGIHKFSPSSQDPWMVTLETALLRLSKTHSAYKRVGHGLRRKLHFDNFVGCKEEGTGGRVWQGTVFEH